MKAVVLNDHGDTSVLTLTERPQPEITTNQVLIKVAAAGLNRADISQRKGHYPAPKGSVQDILGLEVSGTIVSVGSGVEKWKPGQEVCALLPGGGYAEYAAVDAGSCLPVPKTYTLEEAASLPEALLTVWQNIFQIGQLQKDERILIYGGSGGVGAMAIQLTNLFGAHPVTMASSSEKMDYCKSLGAEKVVNYRAQDLVEAFGTNFIDLILDSLGGAYLDSNLELLNTDGRLVYINAMEGKGNLNIFKMMQKRIRLTGSTLRSRSLNHKKALIREAVAQAYPFIEDPAFKVMVNHRFPIDDVVKAHQLMESRDFMGKIILQF